MLHPHHTGGLHASGQGTNQDLPKAWALASLAIERGDTDVMDMLPGTTQVKEDFGTEVFSHFRYQGYCRRTIGSRVRQWVWLATGTVGRAGRRVVGWTRPANR
jgi:hypothetical protein